MEVPQALLLKGPLVCFAWRVPLQALAHHHRQLARAASNRNRWEQAWELHAGEPRLRGALRVWRHALTTLQWKWASAFELWDPISKQAIPLWPSDLGKLLHQARDTLRILTLRKLADRRATFKGLEEGPQREATTKFLDLSPDPYLAALMRDAMAGGIKWGAARHSMGAADNPMCRWCQGAG